VLDANLEQEIALVELASTAGMTARYFAEAVQEIRRFFSSSVRDSKKD
jgi:hypothetical protein